MEWDLVLLILDKIHAIVANYTLENNLFDVLKETVINIEGKQRIINTFLLFINN